MMATSCAICCLQSALLAICCAFLVSCLAATSKHSFHVFCRRRNPQLEIDCKVTKNSQDCERPLWKTPCSSHRRPVAVIMCPPQLQCRRALSLTLSRKSCRREIGACHTARSAVWALRDTIASEFAQLSPHLLSSANLRGTATRKLGERRRFSSCTFCISCTFCPLPR
jgi:hypothetical protein